MSTICHTCGESFSSAPIIILVQQKIILIIGIFYVLNWTSYLIPTFSRKTLNCVLFLIQKTTTRSRVLQRRGLNVSASLSPCAPCSVIVSLPSRRPHQWKNLLALGKELQDFRKEEERTERHQPRCSTTTTTSTTMQILGVPFLPVWLLLGICGAFGGKGRKERKWWKEMKNNLG